MSLLGQNVGGALESEVTRSYNSFSGSDIRAVIGQYAFAESLAVRRSLPAEAPNARRLCRRALVLP